MTGDEIDSPPTLLLLDGHSLAYRAFYALPAENFRTHTGLYTNAVYGFVAMVINLLRDERPTHIAAAFDLSRHTFRTQRYQDYKATRPETPHSFHEQIELIRTFLETLGISVLTAEGYEADDVIATCVTQAQQHHYRSLIVTGDRDALQLVTPMTTVLYPRKGVSELIRFTPEMVYDKYGLTPCQYPDFAALRGDPSDNLPGIPGVGEKTATKWITQYGSLNGLIDHCEEIKGKVGQSLREHLNQVILNRDLTELVRDIPLEINLDQLVFEGGDRHQLNAFFDEVEFSVLRDRLFTILHTSSLSPTQTDTSDQNPIVLSPDVLTEGQLGTWLAHHTHTGPTALVVLGQGRPYDSDTTGIGFASSDGHYTYCDPCQLSDTDQQALGYWLADQRYPKVIHHGKQAIHDLAGRGWSLEAISCDTALAAYLLRPGQRNVSLEELAKTYLDYDIPTVDIPEQPSLLDPHPDSYRSHCLTHAHLTLQLATLLEDQLTHTGQHKLLVDLELPVEVILAKMEQTGIAVDEDRLCELRREFIDQLDQVSTRAYDIIGTKINLSSPKQLQTVLFDQLGMPKTKPTKSGYTTDAEALQSLFEKTGHPFLECLLAHRDMSKLKTTVEGLLASIATDGRIHTTFQQTITTTGRLSSTDPNLQNIPIRTSTGKQIRECFIAAPGYEGIMSADYSQIEMRIMAHLCHDEGLIEAFHSGEDLHSFVASQAFGVPLDQVSSQMRRQVKAMSYGLVYGLGAYGLATQLKISPQEAKEHMDQYFARFGQVRDYLHDIVEQARHDGYTSTLFGRRRYLPGLESPNRQIRQAAERAALNAPIQGSAADIIKAAMIRIDQALHHQQMNSRVLLQIHDELVFEVAPGEYEALSELVTTHMCSVYPLDVPLTVAIGYGPSWAHAAH